MNTNPRNIYEYKKELDEISVDLGFYIEKKQSEKKRRSRARGGRLCEPEMPAGNGMLLGQPGHPPDERVHPVRRRGVSAGFE